MRIVETLSYWMDGTMTSYVYDADKPLETAINVETRPIPWWWFSHYIKEESDK